MSDAAGLSVGMAGMEHSPAPVGTAHPGCSWFALPRSRLPRVWIATTQRSTFCFVLRAEFPFIFRLSLAYVFPEGFVVRKSNGHSVLCDCSCDRFMIMITLISSCVSWEYLKGSIQQMVPSFDYWNCKMENHLIFSWHFVELGRKSFLWRVRP